MYSPVIIFFIKKNIRFYVRKTLFLCLLNKEYFKKARKQMQNQVNSYNEWDPLEEIIVGRLENAMFPEFDLINQYTFPTGEIEFIKQE